MLKDPKPYHFYAALLALTASSIDISVFRSTIVLNNNMLIYLLPLYATLDLIYIPFY